MERSAGCTTKAKNQSAEQKCYICDGEEGDICKCVNYLQRDPRNGTVILVNLRERIWETEGRRWRWNRFFIGYFSRLIEFQSHLHAVWLYARTHTHTQTQFFFKKNQGFPGGSRGKESSCQCRRSKRHRCIAWVGISPGVGNGNLLQYSCLENPRDRGA